VGVEEAKVEENNEADKAEENAEEVQNA